MKCTNLDRPLLPRLEEKNLSPRIFTSIWSSDAEWSDPILIDRRNRYIISYLFEVYNSISSNDVFIIVGSLGFKDRYCDLLAALILRIGWKRPWIIITDATWEARSRAIEQRAPRIASVLPIVAKRIIGFLDDDKVLYCVLSTFEQKLFPHLWRVPSHRVVFTPFCVTLFDWLSKPTQDQGYIFAGGNSLRDYGLLMEAVKGLPIFVKIVTSIKLEAPPSNVSIECLKHDEYMERLLQSSIVVVPLQISQRSAGQQTYLNAMALGKLVIVNDAPGVSDYIEHMKTGIIVENTPNALRSAIIWVLDKKNEIKVDQIKQNAKEVALGQFSFSRYLTRVISVARKAAALPV